MPYHELSWPCWEKVKVQLTAEIAENAEVFKVKTITVYSW